MRLVHISIEQGLSQNTVQAILQDHIGYLWFGTEEGLNRYDGYGFVIFKHDAKDPGSLPNNIVTALYEDRRHRIWVGTQGGLCRFDPRTETFTTVPAIRDRVASLLETGDGTLWVASGGGGLFLLRPDTDAFVSYQPVASDPGSLSSYLTSALLEDRHGRLWIGTSNAGLELFDRKTGEYGRFLHFHHDPADPRSIAQSEIWALAEDKAGNIWVATYGGGLDVLAPEKGGGFRHYRHRADDKFGLPTDLVTSVFVDHAGQVWVGTDGFGVLSYDPATDRFSAVNGTQAGPSKDVVRALYEDAQGQLWACIYQGGVIQLTRGRNEIAYYLPDDADPNGLSDPNVAAFVEDQDGGIWLGTEQGWLNHFDRPTRHFARYRYPPVTAGGNAILSLLRTRRGQLWVGSYRGGIARFDPSTKTFTTFQHDPANPRSLASDEVWAMAEAHDGLLWLATSAGLDCFDPERQECVEHITQPLKSTELRAVRVDRDGRIWVGSFRGLGVFDRAAKTFQDFQHDEKDPHSLSNDAVVSLQEDHLGRLWIGTIGGGLNRFDAATGGFTRFGNFPSSTINSIQEDASNRIWVSTNHGLSRLTPDTGAIENYDLTNGLQSLQFHLGAGIRTSDGHLFFGSTAGFYDLNPIALTKSSYAPPVVLTALRIFNKPIQLPVALPMLDELQIAPDDSVFSLEFAALDYLIPRRNQYAYRLEGFDDRWIEMGDKREITFTNLDPGRYIFRVKASNSDGVWEEASTTSLKIRVIPAMWRTWWFRSGAGALLVFGLFSMHRSRIRRLKRQIAERHRAAEALRASEDRYRALIAGAQDAIFTLGGDGRIQDVNQAGCRITGWEHEKWLGQPFQQVIVAEDVPRVEAKFAEVMAGKRPESFEVRIRPSHHEVVVLEFVLSPVVQNGVAVGLLGIGRDITERLRAAETHARLEAQLFQAQKLEAIGTLAGGIAHDFNNILTGIIGNTQLVELDIASGSPPQEGLKQVMKASRRAQDLVRQILTFSRQQTQQRAPLQLHTVIEEALKLLRPSLPATIEICTQLRPDCPPVLADATQIHQVLMNLATNAAHAMEETGGRLDLKQDLVEVDEAAVRKHPQLRAGRFVRLTVSDTGCGMEAATINRIFEPFFTTKGPGKGTGLGLSVVLGIVQQNEGALLVASEPGKGTTFQVYLPVCATAPGNSTAAPPPTAGRGRGEPLIVVDDDELVVQITSRILTRLGYRTVAFRDPAEALRAIRQNPSDCAMVITDLTMPRMKGTALAAEIRRVRPDLPILLTTGFDGVVDHQELARLKVLGPLLKPFTMEALAAIITEALYPANSHDEPGQTEPKRTPD